MKNHILILTFCFNCTLAQNTITLQECIKSITVKLPTDKQKVQLAEINKKYHIWSLLPNISGYSNYNFNFGRKVDSYTNTFANDLIKSNSFGLNSGFTLFDGLKYYYNKTSLDLKYNMSVINFKINEEQIVKEVMSKYIDLCKIQVLKNSTLMKLEKIKQLQKTQKILYTAGKLNAIDTLKSYISLQNEMMNLSKNESEFLINQISLNHILGFPLTTKFKYDPNSILIESNSINQSKNYVNELLKLDIEHEIENRKIINSNLLPSIALNFFIGTGFSTNNRDYSLLNYPIKPYQNQLNENLNESFSFNINIPIFSKGEYFKQIKLNELKLNELKDKTIQNQKEIEKEKIEYKIKLEYLNNEIELKEKVSLSLEEIYKKMQIIYKDGRTNFTELEYNLMIWLNNVYETEILKIEYKKIKISSQI